MRLQSFVHTIAAVTLLGAPTAALAQGDQNGGTPPNGQWNHTGQTWNNNQNGRRDRDDRDRDDRDRAEDRRRQEQRRHDRERDRNGGYNNGRYNNGGYNNGGYNNGGYNDGRYNDGRYNNGGYNNGRYNGGYNGGYGNGSSQIDGVISGFSSFNLDLNRGPHVHLHQGTVINPTGTTLSPGMRVAVFGHPNGDGTFEADQINVVGNGTYGNSNNGSNPYGNLGSILGRFGL
ncbi:MAG: hypothetical protein ABR591_12010 [Candidatus Velthaea sp.]